MMMGKPQKVGALQKKKTVIIKKQPSAKQILKMMRTNLMA